ncbi:PadR family transcriptional regulator [Halalkalicoccus sp. NIPERK01]|uniref:PadR family transcriptional regulator n=1 Tax=Halalkalicoccus sp. NIPERK01 TaxID=3053469 RepID=UPI00256EF5A8|nr:PadR family transcriptional regulator [Halalkalicoccus sp. NIPERK01]MDL5360591.1 PadR family transcriptional regulator [Halalkalicoccus sp. NIPERK01]
MNVSTKLQRDLLYVIAGHEGATGPALRRTLEAYYRTEIRHDRLSANLDTLREQGFVERVGRADPSYALTDRGRREIDARRAWESKYFDPEKGNDGSVRR